MRGESGRRHIAEPKRLPTGAAPAAAGNVRPYLSIQQLAEVTPWTVDAIRKMVARGVVKLGVHYFRPLGRRRELVFKWDAIVELIEGPTIRCSAAAMVENGEGSLPAKAHKGIDVEQATASFERLLG
ncbi:MAG: hypothetical protein ACHQ9S_23925 [Candidatus Binatia bacterium]